MTEIIVAAGLLVAAGLIVFTFAKIARRARCSRCGATLTRHGWPAGPCDFTKCPFQRGATLGDIS